MKISFNAFSPDSVRAAQKALKEYRDSLASKCTTFAQKLAEIGIDTARMAVDTVDGDVESRSMGKYIIFQTELEPSKHGAKALMIASNTGLIKSEWRAKDGTVKKADVSPILMAEFGSGLNANNPDASKHGMGTGTFPGQTHAEDPSGWWWMDVDGEWHHSHGITPSMPMSRAAGEMFFQIQRVAKEVFGT